MSIMTRKGLPDGRVSAHPVARFGLSSLPILLFMTLLLFGLGVRAGDVAGEDGEAVGNDSPAAASELEAFAGKAPLDGEELDSQRAKAALEVEEVLINSQETTGGVWGNSASGNDSGNNIISDGAFSDAAGFIGTIQNTGNNVLIQNSTIINVAVDP
jgi:hypothetical protein